MLRRIFLFEWGYLARQTSFKVAAAVFFLMGFFMISKGMFEPHIHINGPFSITRLMGLLSLGGIFVVTVFSANSVLKDREHRLVEIIYTCPVGEFPFLFGRFAGSLCAALTIFLCLALGMALGSLMPWLDPNMVGPHHLFNYLWPLLVLVFPNLVFTACLCFGIALWSRNILACYTGGLALYVLYFTAASLLNSPMMAASTPVSGDGLAVAALFDPFGISAFLEQTLYWTVAERNTQRIPLNGLFLYNRLLWTAISLGILVFTYRYFSFELLGTSRKKPSREAASDDNAQDGDPPEPVRLSNLPIKSGSNKAFFSLVKLELIAVFKNKPFLAMVLLTVLMVASEFVSGVANGNFGSPSLPTTALMVRLMGDPLPKMAILVLLYTSAELVWRERALNFHEIVDAAPAGNLVFYGAKLVSLVFIPVFLIAVCGLLGLGFQIFKQAPVIEPFLYLAQFYFLGLPLIQIAVLCLFVQALAPNKILGMIVAGLFLLVSTSNLGSLLGIEHPLLRFATGPYPAYSDMNGYGHFATGFHWYMALWSALTALGCLVTYGLWRRGMDFGIKHRLSRMGTYWGNQGRWIAGLCLLVFMGTGGYIFFHTNIRQVYRPSSVLMNWKADYEKTYKTYADLPQPSITAISSQIDLYPKQHRYEIRGTYRLENRTGEPINRVLVSTRTDLDEVNLSCDAAKDIISDSEFGAFWLDLSQPLKPDDAVDLGFEVKDHNSALVVGGPDAKIVDNGSFLFSIHCFPSIGYRENFELRDPYQRRKRGLEEKDPGGWGDREHLSAESAAGYGRIAFDTVITTAADQWAVAPGNLMTHRREADRHIFHYQTRQPIPNLFAVVSAEYAFHEKIHHGVAVQVLHHPDHRYNLEPMIRAATLSLDMFQAKFGPYPHDHLRIVEVPSLSEGFSGFALPGTVFFLENRAFLADLRTPGAMDLVTRRVAHEVAHQWWGYQLEPANGPGASMLVESLAKVSELMVLEHIYGKSGVRPFMAYEMDRYLRGRTAERAIEVPVTQVIDQPYLYYSKGGNTLYAIKELIGEEPFAKALGTLIAQKAYPNEPPPTATDLYQLLQEATPTKYRPLLKDWLMDVILYDLNLVSAEATQVAGDRYRVSVKVEGSKWRANGLGEESAVPLHEEVPIALLRNHPSRLKGDEDILFYGRRVLKDGITELVLEVDHEPVFVAVDPFLNLMDRNRFDNALQIQIKGNSEHQALVR